MLLSEQVRQIADEENLFHDETEYSGSNVNWTTKITKSITLSEEKNVLVRAKGKLKCTNAGGGTGYGGIRILMDDVPVVASGRYTIDLGDLSNETPIEIETYLKLPAGSYTFKFQIYNYYDGSGTAKTVLEAADIGVFSFTDTHLNCGDSGDISINAGAESTVISKPISICSGRNFCIGRTKKCNLIVIVTGKVEGETVNVMKNPGESNESDRINWKIFVNGTQKSWTERYDDCPIDNNIGYGGYGRYCFAVDVDSSDLTIEVKAYNGFSVSKTVQAYLSVVSSPYLLIDDETEIFTLDFPQGSTLYLVLEPFSRNPTKNVKIGKKRAATFGDSTDYYYTASGTGILDASYTFEMVEVSN